MSSAGRSWRARLFVAVSSAAGACDAGDARTQADLEPVPSTPPSFDVEVGTGLQEFEPVTDSGPVQLVFGPQGGFHIWTAVRTRDTTVEQVQINLSSRYADGGMPAGPPSRWPARLALRDDTRVHAGMRNFIANANAADVVGKTIVLRAEVVASDGRHGAGEVLAIPRSK